MIHETDFTMVKIERKGAEPLVFEKSKIADFSIEVGTSENAPFHTNAENITQDDFLEMFEKGNTVRITLKEGDSRVNVLFKSDCVVGVIFQS